MDATPLVEGLRDFFGPLFFVLLGILGIVELFKLNLARVFGLALMGIVISILLYRPDVIRV